MSSPSSQPPDALHPIYPRVMQPALEDVHMHRHEQQYQTMTYPPPRMPEVVNRPRLYTEFQGSDLQYGFNPGVNNMPTEAAYHPGEYVYPDQERKRRKVSNDSNFTMMDEPNLHYYSNHNDDREVHAPYYPPQKSEYGYQQLLDNGSSRPLMAIESRNDESNSLPSLSEDRPRLLWLPEDQKHLTDLHCFVRKRCVFIFSATSHDVETPRKGRKKALTLGQIGIGCLHCKNSESKLKGSTYFPTSISGIYNATMIIQQRHFPVCPSVSKETYCQYQQLKCLTARSASTKEYWISAAMKLGLVDTIHGVFQSNDSLAPKRILQDPASHYPSQPLVRLVEPSDKIFATGYAFYVMEQMTTCVFTESDRLGKRKSHQVGWPGMACRHCYGGNGSGRFFPLTLKTFSDVSKSIHVLRNHLIKCTRAPPGLAARVNMLYKRHKEEKETTAFGSQKIFFDNIWKRLHPDLCLKKEVEKTKRKEGRSKKKKKKAPEPVKTAEDDVVSSTVQPNNTTTRHDTLQAPHNSSLYSSNDNEPAAAESVDTPLPPLPSPPVIHRGKLSSQDIHQDVTRHNKELCMIPKKRYLYNQRPAMHSESDLSVAMILANGFGRIDSKSSDERTSNEEV